MSGHILWKMWVNCWRLLRWYVCHVPVIVAGSSSKCIELSALTMSGFPIQYLLNTAVLFFMSNICVTADCCIHQNAFSIGMPVSLKPWLALNNLSTCWYKHDSHIKAWKVTATWNIKICLGQNKKNNLFLQSGLKTFMTGGVQIFQKCKRQFKILGTRRVIWSRFYTEEPQILGTIVQNLVTWDLHIHVLVHHEPDSSGAAAWNRLIVWTQDEGWVLTKW